MSKKTQGYVLFGLAALNVVLAIVAVYKGKPAGAFLALPVAVIDLYFGYSLYKEGTEVLPSKYRK